MTPLHHLQYEGFICGSLYRLIKCPIQVKHAAYGQKELCHVGILSPRRVADKRTKTCQFSVWRPASGRENAPSDIGINSTRTDDAGP